MSPRRGGSGSPTGAAVCTGGGGKRAHKSTRKHRQSSPPRKAPDRRGHFGAFGGRYVSETLMPALIELEKAYDAARRDPEFRREFETYLREYAGRPTPLYFAERLTAKLGGARIYFK